MKTFLPPPRIVAAGLAGAAQGLYVGAMFQADQALPAFFEPLIPGSFLPLLSIGAVIVLAFVTATAPRTWLKALFFSILVALGVLEAVHFTTQLMWPLGGGPPRPRWDMAWPMAPVAGAAAAGAVFISPPAPSRQG